MCLTGVIFVDIDECAYKKAGCAHLCTNKPGSYECECYNGYYMSANKRYCISKFVLNTVEVLKCLSLGIFIKIF